jgi:hypothetical protein
VNRFIIQLRMVPHRKLQRPVEAGVALTTPGLMRRPTIITSHKAARAPLLVALEAKQFTSARPWCSNAGRVIRFLIIRPPVIRRPETILRPAIRLRVALRVSMAAVAAALRPSMVVEAAVIAAAVVAAVALLDPMAAEAVAPDPTAAVVVAVTAVAEAEATVKI